MDLPEIPGICVVEDMGKRRLPAVEFHLEHTGDVDVIINNQAVTPVPLCMHVEILFNGPAQTGDEKGGE